ncbi:MAG: tetratricopeptide repeat protein [Nitrospinae bacterium]|nr:tetratricopeptide repeat protein [Nitrospinota bacterium]
MRPREILIAVCLAVLLLAGPGRGDVGPEEAKLGYSLLDQWRVEEADTLARSLVKANPDSGDAHFLDARVQFYKGNYGQAANILKTLSDSQRTVRDFKSLVERTREATAGFVSEQSEHFEFRYKGGPDRVLVHYARDALERSYQVLGGLFGHFPAEKIRVEIYPDKDPFSRISPLTLKDILTSGTVALCKYNRLMMISPGSLVRGYNWMDTLSHEYTHYLLAKISHNNVPLWLNEGIAKFFESRWRGENNSMEPIMENVLAQGLANDYFIPLESMMPSLAKLKNAEDVQLAYAQVATMVDYLVSLKGERVIADILADLGREIPFEETWEKRSGKDLAEFQKDWKDYMKQKRLNAIPGLKVLAFQFKSDRKEKDDETDYGAIDDKTARDLAFLGDVLKSRSHVKAAILEYRKAVKESPSLSPILHNKLAGTYLLAKEYDQAEALLKESLKYYPAFHTTLANLGEIYYESGKYELAGAYFESAVRTNPFNPFVHERLIAIDKKLGKTKEAELQARLYRYLE